LIEQRFPLIDEDQMKLLLKSKRSKRLENDLCLANSQSIKYAHDLSVLYKEAKIQKTELSNANGQLKKYAADLRRTVSILKSVNNELQEAYYDTIQRLVLAVEYKDQFTGQHIVRMSRYSALIAEKSGLPERDVLNILYAAPMHDVGKIGIPDSIITSPNKLSADEFAVMKRHTIIGAEILDNAKSQILIIARQIAISHHEKWNGQGYPYGLKEDKIPLVGRIVGLADTFDVLTSKRSYKDPFPIEYAADVIKKERGKHFDPDLVDVFMNNLDKLAKINVDAALAAEK
jgi:putative two-component system response regulator